MRGGEAEKGGEVEGGRMDSEGRGGGIRDSEVRGEEGQ